MNTLTDRNCCVLYEVNVWRDVSDRWNYLTTTRNKLIFIL